VTINGSPAFYSQVPQNEVDVIRSVRNGITNMVQVYTNAALDAYASANCFYFDASTYSLYCNFGTSNGIPFQQPYNLTIEVGIITGFSTAVDYSRNAGAYYSNILYAPRIKKIPAISKKVDNLQYGVLRKSETQLTLINSDGYFDDANYEGATFRLFGLDNGDEISDGVIVDSGVITKQVISHTELNISVGSKRESVNNLINLGVVFSPPISFDISESSTTGTDGTVTTTTETAMLSSDYAGNLTMTTGTSISITATDGSITNSGSSTAPVSLGTTLASPIVLGTNNTTTTESDTSIYNGTVTATTQQQILSMDEDGNIIQTTNTSCMITQMINGVAQPTTSSAGSVQTVITPVPIPIMYGQIVKYQPLPIANDLSTVTYLFCATQANDTANGVIRQPTAVSDIWYVDDNNVTNSILADCTINYSTGTFTVSTDYAYSNGSYQTIYMSFMGWHNSAGQPLTGIEIILDLLSVVSDYNRTSTNYDMESIINGIATQKSMGRNVSIIIDDITTKVLDKFSDICRDTDLYFIENSDGTFAARVDQRPTDSILTIEPQTLLAWPQYSTDIQNLITQLTLKWGCAGNDDNRTDYVNKASQAQIMATYQIINATTIDSCLADLQSAIDKVNHVLSKALNPITSTQFKIPLDKTNAGIGLISSITAPRNRKFETALWQVTGIEKDLEKNQLTISCDLLSASAYASGYIQGCLDGAELSNSKYLSVTHTE